jgi:hypothetical protein
MPSNNKTEIKTLIALEAQRQGVPVDLALALAKQESGFNPSAKSPAGAIGVMQLMPATAKGLGVNPNNVQENIRGGIAYLKQQLNRFNGNYELALAAYNAGPGAVNKAKGVPNIKETQNYVKNIMTSVTPNQITGAAAPISSDVNDVGERLSDIQTDYINAAQQGISQYASQPYDPSLGLALRQQRAKEYLDQFNRVVNETPMSLTPEQQQQILNNFAATGQAVQDMTKQTQDRIQQMSGSNQYQPYEEKIRRAYEDQIARLQELNPYTRLAQTAPLEALEPLDIQKIKNAQAADRFGTALSAMTNPVAGRPDYAAIRKQQLDELQAAQEFNRAQQAAKATGLNPAEFIQGGIADYNTMNASLNAQNQALVNLYDRAMAGDQQAMQILGNLAQNANNQVVGNQVNAYNALNQAMQNQRAAAEANWNRRQQMLQGIQGLDPTMVAGANQIQGQNIGTAGSMYNTGINAGVNQGQNIVRYETGMIPNAATAQDEIKPITPQQYGSTLLNAAAMSNNPGAFQQAVDAYGNIARQYGSFDPRFVQPIQTNTFLPN